MGGIFRTTVIATAIATTSAAFAAGAPTLGITLGTQNVLAQLLPIPALAGIPNSLTLQLPLLASPALPAAPAIPATPALPSAGAGTATSPLSGLAGLPGASTLTGLFSGLLALFTGAPAASGSAPAPSLPPQALNGATTGSGSADGGAMLSQPGPVDPGVRASLAAR